MEDEKVKTVKDTLAPKETSWSSRGKGYSGQSQLWINSSTRRHVKGMKEDMAGARWIKAAGRR